MKKYLVTIEMIKVTRMVVGGKNKMHAVNKVNNLLKDCVEYGYDLNASFEGKPTFKYKAVKIKKE